MRRSNALHSSLLATSILGAGLGVLLVGTAAAAQDTPAPAPAPAQTAASGSTLEEVVVTAQKREETLSKVPESVTAVTNKTLEIQHIDTVIDLARITPGLVFDTQAGSGQQRNSAITIRGITSTNGVPTVGVYLDDSPMTIRDIATGGTNNFFPALFDLARVEVLRGPQGTLFGAGSEGGTVRFIGEQPSVSSFSGHALAEIGYTDGGAPSYQLGIAEGGPIVQDKIGFRASIYWRQDGGYVDKYDFNTGDLIKRNANTDNTYSGRLAFTFKPTENFTITPSVFVQRLDSDDINRITLPAELNTIAGSPSPAPILVNQGPKGNYTSYPNTLRDDFYISSLKAEYELPWVKITSVTSYLNRIQDEHEDIHTWVQLFDGAPDPFVPGAPGYKATTTDHNTAHNFTQELRFSSNNADSPFQWVGGLYYARNRQNSRELVYSQTFADLVTLPGLGPYFASLLPDYVQGQSFDVDVQQGSLDKQWAGFGQVDYKLWNAVTLTAGLRAEKDTVDFYEVEGGPVGRGGHGPAGQLLGDPEYAHEEDTAYIPKFGINWQINPEDMVYGTVAKGFRPGGQNTVNGVVTPACAAGLAQLGLSELPLTFGPDNVWSYEIGSKNRLDNNRVQIDGSAFYVKWSNLQQQVNIGCTTPFVSNLGQATSKGFDLDIHAQLMEGLILGASVGYTDTRFDKTIAAGTLVVAEQGDPLPNVIPWTVTLNADYTHDLSATYQGYFHVDYQYLSGEPAGDPIVTGWDPTINSNGTFAPNPAYGIVNLRAGVRHGPMDVSLFLLNAGNASPRLNYGREQFLTSGIYKYNEYRPLTVGLTATAHWF